MKLHIGKINENWHNLKWWGGRGVLLVGKSEDQECQQKINCFRKEEAKGWASGLNSLKVQQSQLSISKFYFLGVSID